MGPLVATPPAGLPGPRGLPLVGSLLPFARDPLGFLIDLQRYGDLAACWLVELPVVQVSHPEAVEEVLVRHARVMHKDRIYELLRPLLGNGLVTAEDETWKRHRRLAAPSFTPKQVAGYAATMVDATREWAEAQADGHRLDVHHELMGLTQRIVLRTLFGADLADDGGAAVGRAIETVMEAFVSEAQGAGRLIPGFVPTPSRRRSAEAIAELDRVIYGLVAARRAAGPGDDLLSRLLAARDDAGAGFSDAELRDEAVTLFVAGHETTALALTFALLLLGEHPQVERTLAAEVRAVLGDRPAEAADLGRLPYTAAVIKEAMRVLPPVWAIGREATEDVEVSGVRIARGTQLLISPWVLHRDPRWFDAPEVFRPERWLEGLEERLPRMAWLPFGGGPRVCIGNHFAMLEAVLVLATLAQTAWPRTTGPRPRLLPSITLRPRDPVPAVVERREAT